MASRGFEGKISIPLVVSYGCDEFDYGSCDLRGLKLSLSSWVSREAQRVRVGRAVDLSFIPKLVMN